MNKYYRLEITYTNSERVKVDNFDFSAIDDEGAQQKAQSILQDYSDSTSNHLYCIGHEIPVQTNENTEPIAQLIAQPSTSTMNSGEDQTNYMSRTCYLVPSSYDFAGNSANNVTTVTNINILSDIGDYQAMWYMMHGVVTSLGGIQNLSVEEQAIAGEWLVMDEKKVNKLIKARRKRVNKISAILWNELSRTEAEAVMDDISSPNLLMKYIEENRQGTSEGDQEGVLDYLNGTSSFSGSGFIDKGWVPSTMTLPDLSSKISNIIKYGGD